MNRVAYNGTRIERRTVAVAIARLLVESTDACSANGQRMDVWRDALAECVKLVGGQQLKQSIIVTNDEQKRDENEFVSDVESMLSLICRPLQVDFPDEDSGGYTASHATLTFAGASSGDLDDMTGPSWNLCVAYYQIPPIADTDAEERVYLVKQLEMLSTRQPAVAQELMKGVNADALTFIRQSQVAANGAGPLLAS